MSLPAGEATFAIADLDSTLAQRIVDVHIWAVKAGLRGADAPELFDGYCQRLVINGTPLWRAHSAMETLHPQWRGYGVTWRRDLNAIAPESYPHGDDDDPGWVRSPFNALIERARAGEANPTMRRRLAAGPAERDFPALEEFFAAGAADYAAYLFVYGDPAAMGAAQADRSHGGGVVYSFATDRKSGFADDDLALVEATLPALALAMKAHAGHAIASGLLRAYLGWDAGGRVHAGAVTRGSMERLTAAILFADIRGFTPLSDSAPGPAVIDLLNDAFEAMAAPLRERGGQVLKFIGDAMLATFSFDEEGRAATCARALDAAVEARGNLEAMNRVRAEAGAPVAEVDFALHAGEVLYGNVGAADRLDFTAIGPAINEAVRIEALCQPLGRAILVSAEFAAILRDAGRPLPSLGLHALRGVRAPKELFALDDDGAATAPGSA
ncbi:adenylate/guanylate cyclase [Roseiarcus fermentans]|uniref:Adenylate/guanylate cyclase n=1 Tax=Roseiarcus fermentans TaxID=1473586 RepID=A0A366ENN1_9HYPH|nr:adenylate/guanylate cyclase domain-containing protein [Roseiarcus fermentans]RBP03099.1 adenylate/guanylate cyclase [Roseiarcus fermentans]